MAIKTYFVDGKGRIDISNVEENDFLAHYPNAIQVLSEEEKQAIRNAMLAETRKITRNPALTPKNDEELANRYNRAQALTQMPGYSETPLNKAQLGYLEGQKAGKKFLAETPVNQADLYTKGDILGYHMPTLKGALKYSKDAIGGFITSLASIPIQSVSIPALNLINSEYHAQMLQGFIDQKQQQYAGNTDALGALKRGDVGGFLGMGFKTFIQSAPITAAWIVNPYLGAGVSVGAGATPKYSQLDRDLPELAQGTKLLSAANAGAWEAGSEYISMLLGFGKTIKMGSKLPEQILRDKISKAIKSRALGMMGKQWAIESGVEGAEEVANFTGDYLGDVVLGIKDFNSAEFRDGNINAGILGAAAGGWQGGIGMTRNMLINSRYMNIDSKLKKAANIDVESIKDPHERNIAAQVKSLAQKTIEAVSLAQSGDTAGAQAIASENVATISLMRSLNATSKVHDTIGLYNSIIIDTINEQTGVTDAAKTPTEAPVSQPILEVQQPDKPTPFDIKAILTPVREAIASKDAEQIANAEQIIQTAMSNAPTPQAENELRVAMSQLKKAKKEGTNVSKTPNSTGEILRINVKETKAKAESQAKHQEGVQVVPVVAENATTESAQPVTETEIKPEVKAEKPKVATKMEDIPLETKQSKSLTVGKIDENIERTDPKESKSIQEDKVGKTVTVSKKGKDLKIRYALIDRDKIVVSHSTGFQENAEYPQEIQNRQRDKTSLRGDTATLSAKLNPDLLMDNPIASDGRPIVIIDKNGKPIALTGNGRLIAMNIKAESKDGLAEYEGKLKERLADFGISDQDTKGKVLVGVYYGGENLVELARLLNVGEQKTLTKTEQATSDATLLANAKKEGNDLLLKLDMGTQALMSAANTPFIEEFISMAIPDTAGYKTDNGSYTNELEDRIENALFMYIFNNDSRANKLLEAYRETGESNVKFMLNGIMDNLKQIARLRNLIEKHGLLDLDITKDLIDTLSEVSRLRAEGVKLEEVAFEQDLFSNNQEYISDDKLALYQAVAGINSNNKAKLFIAGYYASAYDAINPDQSTIFSSAVDSKEQFLDTYAKEWMVNYGQKTKGKPVENLVPQKLEEDRSKAKETKPEEQKPIGSYARKQTDSTGVWQNITEDVYALSDPINIRGKVSGGNWAVEVTVKTGLGKTGLSTYSEHFWTKKEAQTFIDKVKSNPAAPAAEAKITQSTFAEQRTIGEAKRNEDKYPPDVREYLMGIEQDPRIDDIVLVEHGKPQNYKYTVPEDMRDFGIKQLRYLIKAKRMGETKIYGLFSSNGGTDEIDTNIYYTEEHVASDYGKRWMESPEYKAIESSIASSMKAFKIREKTDERVLDIRAKRDAAIKDLFEKSDTEISREEKRKALRVLRENAESAVKKITQSIDKEYERLNAAYAKQVSDIYAKVMGKRSSSLDKEASNAATMTATTPITQATFAEQYRKAQEGKLSKEQIDAQLATWDAIMGVWEKEKGISLDDAYADWIEGVTNAMPKGNALNQSPDSPEAQYSAVRKQYEKPKAKPVVTDERGEEFNGAGYYQGLREATYKGKLFHKGGWDALNMLRESSYKGRSPSYSTEQSERLMNAFRSDLVLVMDVNVKGEYYRADAGSGNYSGYDEFIVSMPHDKFIKSIDKIIMSKSFMDIVNKIDDIDTASEELGLSDAEREFIGRMTGYDSPVYDKIVSAKESGYSPEFLNFDDMSGDKNATQQYKPGYMKAPNGKPSNLNERQWIQVRTPNFLNWFGDWLNDPKNASKVVDENGEPMVVYHGTPSQDYITELWAGYTNNMHLFNRGIYATANPEISSGYAKDTGQVYPLFMNIRNPIDMDASINKDIWIKKGGLSASDLSAAKTNEDGFQSLLQSIADEFTPRYEVYEQINEAIIQMGFDGVTHLGGGRVNPIGKRHKVYITSGDNSTYQIKSATANTGEFSPENADIRYQDMLAYVTKNHDGKYTIGFLSPNFSSGLHEQAHIGRSMIAKLAETSPIWKDRLNAAEAWCGVKDGNWTTEAEEKFAKGYEKYLLDGAAPNSKLKTIFAKIKAWMQEIVGKVKELSGIKLDANIIATYDAMLGVTPTKAEQVKSRVISDTSSDPVKLETAMDKMVEKLPITIKARKTGSKITFFINSVDTGDTLVEVTHTADGYLVNDGAYANNAEALEEITRLLDANSKTLYQTKDPDEKLAAALKAKERKNTATQAVYRLLQLKLKSPLTVTNWRNAMMHTIDRVIRIQNANAIPFNAALADAIINDENLTEEEVAKKIAKMEANDKLYRKALQSMTGFEDLANISTISLFTVIEEAAPDAYAEFVNDETIKIFRTMMPELAKMQEFTGIVYSDMFLKNLIDTVLSGQAVASQINRWTKLTMQTHRVMVRLFGKAGMNTVRIAYLGNLKHSAINSSAQPYLKQLNITLNTSKNNRGARYETKELRIITDAFYSIEENKEITDKLPAIIAAIQDKAPNINTQDITDAYKNAKSLLSFVADLIKEFNATHKKQIGLQEDYFPRQYDMRDIMELGRPSTRYLYAPSSTKSRELEKSEPASMPDNLHQIMRNYLYKMSKYLAYYDLAQYVDPDPVIIGYSDKAKEKPIFKDTTSQFKRDLDIGLAATEKQNQDYMKEFVHATIGYYKPSGSIDRAFTMIKNSIYTSVLAGNINLTIQNFMQRFLMYSAVDADVANATLTHVKYWSGKLKNADNSPLFKSIMQDYVTHNSNLIAETQSEAKHTAEMAISPIQYSVTNAYYQYSKLLSASPFQKAELGNRGWGHAAGVLQVVMNSPEYKAAKKSGKTWEQSVETALQNPQIYDAAKLMGGAVNAEINADADIAFSPSLYRTEVGHFFTFTRYAHSFILLLTRNLMPVSMKSKWSGNLHNLLMSGQKGAIGTAEAIKMAAMIKEMTSDSRMRRLQATPVRGEGDKYISRAEAARMHKYMTGLLDQYIANASKDFPSIVKGAKGNSRKMAAVVSFVMTDALVNLLFAMALTAWHGAIGSDDDKQKPQSYIQNLLRSFQILRFGGGATLGAGMLPQINLKYGTKYNVKATTRWLTNALPFVGLVNSLSKQLAGMSPTDQLTELMLDE